MAKKKSKKIKIATHTDADGISAAVLLGKALKMKRKDITVYFPDEFGGYDGDEDYMLDMKPVDGNFKGIVIDHHPQHPSKKKRKYQLFHGDVPTGVLVFNKFKDTIPKSEWFKVAIAAVGDVSPEAIPVEVFKEHPDLLNKEIYFDNDWKIWLSLYKFKQLSSPINAIARFGEYKKAFDILYEAKTVDDVLLNSSFQYYKKKQNGQMKTIKFAWGNALPRPKLIKNLFMFIVINSPFNMQNYVASKMSAQHDITSVCINVTSGSISIRGTFTRLIVNALNENGIEAGGHSVASGGHLPNTKTFHDLERILEHVI